MPPARPRPSTVGDRTYPVAGDTWEDYRCELMAGLSQQRLLAAAKRVNPKARLIIKYPQWYDRFHERGYDVLRRDGRLRPHLGRHRDARLRR